MQINNKVCLINEYTLKNIMKHLLKPTEFLKNEKNLKNLT